MQQGNMKKYSQISLSSHLQSNSRKVGLFSIARIWKAGFTRPRKPEYAYELQHLRGSERAGPTLVRHVPRGVGSN